jgi:hypothetical protein
VAFDPRRELLASGGLDHRIIIWDVAEVRRVLTADPAELLSETQRDTCFKLQDEQVDFQPCQNVSTEVPRSATGEVAWPSIVAAVP